MVDLGAETAEELGEPLGVVRPGLARHEVPVAGDLADPVAAGTADVGLESRIPRTRAALEDVRGREDPDAVTECGDGFVVLEEVTSYLEDLVVRPEVLFRAGRMSTRNPRRNRQPEAEFDVSSCITTCAFDDARRKVCWMIARRPRVSTRVDRPAREHEKGTLASV